MNHFFHSDITLVCSLLFEVHFVYTDTIIRLVGSQLNSQCVLVNKKRFLS